MDWKWLETLKFGFGFWRVMEGLCDPSRIEAATDQSWKYGSSERIESNSQTFTSLKHQFNLVSAHTQYCIAIIVTCNYTSTMFQLSRSLMLCDATGGPQMNQTSGYIGSCSRGFWGRPIPEAKSLLQCYGHSAPPCPTNTMPFKDGVGSVLRSRNRHVTLLNWPHPNEFAVCVGWLSAPLDSSPAASVVFLAGEVGSKFIADRSNMGIMEHWVRTRNINVIRDDSMAVCGTSD